MPPASRQRQHCCLSPTVRAHLRRRCAGADLPRHQARTGRGNTAFTSCARAFLRRWPDVRDWAHEPLAVQLSANSGTRPFITFLLVTGRLHPGWDYLVHRKFSSIWRDVPGHAHRRRISTGSWPRPARAGIPERVASAMASQVSARVLFPTGKAPGRARPTPTSTRSPRPAHARQAATGRTWKHYRATATQPRRCCSTSGSLPALPTPLQQRRPFAHRLADVPEPMHTILVRYLDRKSVTCQPRHGLLARDPAGSTSAPDLAELDPDTTPATLDRRRHIEPWLARLTTRSTPRPAGPCPSPEQRPPDPGRRELPDRDHRMGLARSPHPAAGVPRRQPRAYPSPCHGSCPWTPTGA